jgi:hypothetical protein
MSPRALTWLLCSHLAATALACAALHVWIGLRPASGVRIVSDWRDGRRIARHVADSAEPCSAPCTQLVERVVAQGPLPMSPPLLLALSIVAGRDGIAATLDGRTAYLTPDDLLARQAEAEGVRIGKLALRSGLDDPNAVLDALATQLHSSRATLIARGRLRRFIVLREAPASLWPQPSAAVTASALTAAADAGMAYLARNQRRDGSFNYLLTATTGEAPPGGPEINWPRHGGATLTLAQWAARTHERATADAAIRAAKLLQAHTGACGSMRCVGDQTKVDAGSSALALLAYLELSNAGISRAFDADIAALTKFLRSLQRPDGEFMHVYDREHRRALDVHYRYYSGEMALALARAARFLNDAGAQHAASRALQRHTRRSLIVNRYFFGQEHWTCQALEALWERAPDRDALAFCLDHEAFLRMTQDHGDVLNAFGGGYAPHPFAPPRMAATGSRTEGALATLATARAAGVSPAQLDALERQARAGLAFILRHQFLPGPAHLFRDPARVHGGIPGSPTDFTIRIDYQQHVVGAIVRWLRLHER